MATYSVSTTTVVPLPKRRGRSRKVKSPAKVLQFVPRHRGPVVQHDIVRELEKLLHYARLGRVDSFAWAGTRSDSGAGCGARVGSSDNNDELFRAMAAVMRNITTTAAL